MKLSKTQQEVMDILTTKENPALTTEGWGHMGKLFYTDGGFRPCLRVRMETIIALQTACLIEPVRKEKGDVGPTQYILRK